MTASDERHRPGNTDEGTQGQRDIRTPRLRDLELKAYRRQIAEFEDTVTQLRETIATLRHRLDQAEEAKAQLAEQCAEEHNARVAKDLDAATAITSQLEIINE